MVNQELTDKLVEINAILQDLCDRRDAIYSTLATLNQDIKITQDTKTRLEQAIATIGGIDDKATDKATKGT